MIRLAGEHQPLTGPRHGVVRDSRLPWPGADPPTLGAVFGFGDDTSGPLVSLTIEPRRYPRRAPVHMHKADTFRMALGQPIVVGRTAYGHGDFRLQEADAFYGPEVWTDEVGTNQLLVIADRRGAKPYLAATEHQGLVDDSFAADASVAGIVMHERDAFVVNGLADNIQSVVHAGHWDGGFSATDRWARLDDGSRLAVIAMGAPASGPVIICWDRPPGSPPLPSVTSACDMLRLVVSGEAVLDGSRRPQMAFSLVPAGQRQESVRPGAEGLQELWCLASGDSSPVWHVSGDDGSGARISEQLVHHLDDVRAHWHRRGT